MVIPRDGGPAFPQPIHKCQFDTTPQDFKDTGCGGMSMRDYFAGMALQGLYANPGWFLSVEAAQKSGQASAETVYLTVKAAYRAADFMLKERTGL